MVGMLMRDQYAVNPVDLCIEKLHPQIGRTIDQNTRDLSLPLRTFDQ
jgi:hypothetical protein